LKRPFLHSICRFWHISRGLPCAPFRVLARRRISRRVAVNRRVALAALGTGLVALVASRPAQAQMKVARQLVWGMGDIAGELAQMKA
jgi:hypothetical protein